MAMKTSRRGIMIPKACFWPLMGIFLIIFIFDRCTRHWGTVTGRIGVSP